jgi:hypothetical protein
MPIADTYESISSQTLASTSATVVFTGIPQTYTDLVLVINARKGSASSEFDAWMRFNGISTSIYGETSFYGTAGDVRGTVNDYNRTSSRLANLTFIDTDYTLVISNLMNYTSTSMYKTSISYGGSSGGNLGLSVSTWESTAAIASITIASGVSFPNAGAHFDAGSTFSLYGIKNA